jgi:hypothetical protein
MTIAFNPMQTLNAGGQFRLLSDGYVQGATMDDPAARYSLSGGFLAPSETLPMWGGVGIYEDTSGGLQVNGADSLGQAVGRAASLATMVGFSVFNQNHAWIQVPGSPVPLAGSNQTVSFHRFGSGARLAVAMDPALVTLQGGLVTQAASWDFTNQMLVPYAPVEAVETITGITWANTNGGTATATTSAAHGYAVGDDVTLVGTIPTIYSGQSKILTVPSGTTFTFAVPATTNPGNATTPGTIAGGGGLLPVKIINVNIGGSKTVLYNPLTNITAWNPNGSAALILL